MHLETRRLWHACVLAFLAVGAAIVLDAQRQGGPAADQPVEGLRFRYMGPPSAGRIASVAGIPGDQKTYYAGAASGGVWKTSDGGQTFEPTFDAQPVQAIGALAVAPSSPNIVWAGTGEAWAIRDSDVMGDGIYKSSDAGTTWTNVGLRETGRIGRILVHPSNPDIVFACALGRTTGPQDERGGWWRVVVTVILFLAAMLLGDLIIFASPSAGLNDTIKHLPLFFKQMVRPL